MDNNIKRLAVIGTGSAGVLALSHFLTYLPKDWEIYSIYDPNTPRVGIGESTNPSFVSSLDTSIDFHVLRDLKEINGSIKYATVFKNWRKEHFYHPLLGGSNAIHFNTHKLFDFVAEKFRIKYKNKFKSYYSKKIFDGRILKQGNAAIFFEPISATSLWLYDQINRMFMDYLLGANLRNSEDIEPTIENVNSQFINIANQVEELICYYYHGGSIYDTPFWNNTVRLTNDRLKRSENLERMKKSFEIHNENGTPVNAGQWCFTAPGLMKIDKNFNYYYFTEKE